MEILKAATDWARAEVFSSVFFIAVGVLFILVSIGFWQLGKTDIAKAYIIPIMAVGILLSIIGTGLTYTNKTRITQFTEAHKEDPAAFIDSEIERTDGTLNEYKTVVFKGIPIIILVAALLIFFVDAPTWRAISITTLVMMSVILFIDGMAHARMDAYRVQLDAAKKQIGQ